MTAFWGYVRWHVDPGCLCFCLGLGRAGLRLPDHVVHLTVLAPGKLGLVVQSEPCGFVFGLGLLGISQHFVDGLID